MTAEPSGAPVVDLDGLVAEARAGLRRLSPAEAAHAVAHDGALLVDIRPEAQRRREGDIPGSVVIDRNVLEWRLAPGAEHRIPELRDAAQTIVVFCSQGYASSLAAATLQRLGLSGATDLDGGFLAWDAAGLPTVPVGSHPPPVERTAPVRRPGGAGREVRSA
jgi:rhodanese-related sulfurtransferase